MKKAKTEAEAGKQKDSETGKNTIPSTITPSTTTAATTTNYPYPYPYPYSPQQMMMMYNNAYMYAYGAPTAGGAVVGAVAGGVNTSNNTINSNSNNNITNATITNATAPSVATNPWNPSSLPPRPSYAADTGNTGNTGSKKVNVSVKTSMASVNTTGKPIPTTNTSNNTQWSAPMKAYVERAFASCATAAQKDAMEEALRLKIKAVMASKTMNAIDWSKEPLPSIGVISGASNEVSKGKTGKNNTPLAKTSNNVTPNTNIPIHNMSKLEERQRRFEADEREFRRQQEQNRISLQNVSIHDNLAHVPDWDEETIVGTCQRLEKPYLRLTSAPDPATVRPLPVLKRALEWLKTEWRKRGPKEYAFICDQFKSLRQDMTVQRIKSEFTVRVYEIHARIAIESGDWGEYNQCQTQLKGLYGQGLAGAESEFLAYRLLYCIQCSDWQGLNRFLVEIGERRGETVIEHALGVQEALLLGNYAAFFKLYREAPNMGGYFLDMIVERERMRAFKAILRAYRPTVSVKLLTESLGFTDQGECKQWVLSAGVDDVEGEVIDCKTTLQKVLAK